MFLIFFFNDTATTEIYTLSLHDALPILPRHADHGDLLPCHLPQRQEDKARKSSALPLRGGSRRGRLQTLQGVDRKSTRLNSSHANISYAVFCLKKKKIQMM